jgi:serine/threonine-protein kinase RsbW
VEGIALHILNLQPELHDEFFREAKLPGDVQLKVYKTFPRFLKSIQKGSTGAINILMFLPEQKLDAHRARLVRIAKLESPIYIITDACSEKEYLTYLSLGINGIFSPPFSPADIQHILNGHVAEDLPFPRSDDLVKEGQIRLDFLVPSKLSRILGVNRLVSFLTAEFGFPPEESKVNLPLVVDEALSNAIVHGNNCREDLKVHVRIYISSRRILIQVEDQGEGFTPHEQRDPTQGEELFKDSGRGIFLIRELMDSVAFKKGGRVIEMERQNDFFKE